MGAPPSEPHADDDERPFLAILSKPFYMGVTEVTQGQYQKVMGTNPSSFKDAQDPERSANMPVEQVSWEDAVEFCRRLSAMPEEKQRNRIYRLPTEAQWEYACRAGQQGPFGFDSATHELGQFAWFADNSGDKLLDSNRIWKEAQEDLDGYLKVLKGNRCRTHAAGQKKPNAWGLYDMHGNVGEWCADWYDDYPKGQATDPTGPQKGTDRVVRGGGFHFQSKDCRSAERLGSFPTNRVDDLGFRVIVVVD
jgi:formylglycine-generating enzyme required for sulfatase activity